jgi:hypothetical protein
MGKQIKYFLLAFCGLAFGAFYGHSNDLSFRASAPSVVSAGEQFRYTLVLNASGSNLRLPEFDGFRLIMGPSTSSSTSVQYINGQMSRTQTTTYTFVLQAEKEGDFTISPASIVVDGKPIESNAINIDVVTGQVPQTPSTTPDRQAPSDAPSSSGTGADLFIRAIINKTNVYQGEPLVVTFKLYTKLDATNLENPKLPALNGFYQQEIEIQPLRSLDREVVNGEIYGTGVLRKVLLFPQRAGELYIDPYELDVIVRETPAPGRRGFFDDFFTMPQMVRKKAVSPNIRINVKPLPQGRPAGFAGAVGNFKVHTTVDKTQAPANEPITYTIKISGSGNLKLIEQPRVDFPIGFEVFDAKLRESIRNTDEGATGSKTFEILMIPRHAGTYRIPPLNFSYFDPVSASYKSLKTEEISLQVEKGDETETGAAVTGFSREDVRLIGEDIRFIKLHQPSFRNYNIVLFGTPAYILALAIPLVLFVLLVILYRKHLQLRADVKRVRNRRARKVALKRLKQAARMLRENNTQEFYDEILNSAWGYLGDKLSIPLSDLSRNTIMETTAGEPELQTLLAELFEVLETCEAARYSPGYSGSEMDVVYEKVSRLIEAIEQKIQKA